MPDDEPLSVLDPQAGRGYALTMRGIGDDPQPHILPADRLIGDATVGRRLPVLCRPNSRHLLGAEEAEVRLRRRVPGRARPSRTT